MPVRVKPHRRGAKEAKVVVITPTETKLEPTPTLRERIKREFAIPPKRKKPKFPKTEAEEFADDADRLAKTLEEME